MEAVRKRKKFRDQRFMPCLSQSAVHARSNDGGYTQAHKGLPHDRVGGRTQGVMSMR